MRNVRCAGRPVEHRRSVIDGRADIVIGEPCGWKGRRNYRYLDEDPTKKSCPRCGGRVELIEVER